MRRKSLLIGINYTGTSAALGGCHEDVENITEFLDSRGYPSDSRSRVTLIDLPDVPHDSQYYPTGRNILAAMDWLVGEPGYTLFLHYSGHGGLVHDVDGNRNGGKDNSIVPIDYERNGQISSTVLHEHLVTHMAADCTLFIILDCCHSGSAVELPYVYRSDSDGQISLIDNLKAGIKLMGDARDLIGGGFNQNSLANAQSLFAGATSLFKGLQHRDEQEEEGLQDGEFHGQYGSENKVVTMFSGCQDDQTSADARIDGEATGAMTWAFLQVMKEVESPNYIETLQRTRKLLDQSNYTQIPQLSCGTEMDLENTHLLL